ncbi:hypothetical protein KIN20_034477 [Parelaphostrongylus tenuis]|uniref:Uncharacterized protein n=1 Tax=Parelaphostrongylus tenuis TaxID=148309 RepID=A0AAD5R9R2_PARTN|nr:hypothetical protein KIN20_034477 [Parelaphostrongylus tenuis]
MIACTPTLQNRNFHFISMLTLLRISRRANGSDTGAHIKERADDGLTKRRVRWTPRECSRPPGRPSKREADVFVCNVNHLNPHMATSSGLRNAP